MGLQCCGVLCDVFLYETLQKFQWHGQNAMTIRHTSPATPPARLPLALLYPIDFSRRGAQVYANHNTIIAYYKVKTPDTNNPLACLMPVVDEDAERPSSRTPRGWAWIARARIDCQLLATEEAGGDS